MAGEYEEIVKKIPGPERAIGPLAGLATRLDYLGPKVVEISPKVAELGEKVGKLESALRTMPQKIEQIPFSYNLAALQGVMLNEHAPFSGYIKQISIHWPPGCNALVDVRVGHGTKQFCPNEGYLALDNVTPTYPFNERIADHEEIWVELRNTDGVNSHAITVTVILEGAAS